MYVVPAETYDYLRQRAEAAGGVGHTKFYEGDVLGRQKVTPLCIHGCATGTGPRGEHVSVLMGCGITYEVNDGVFTEDERKQEYFRLSWDEWCRRVEVTRGE